MSIAVLATAAVATGERPAHGDPAQEYPAHGTAAYRATSRSPGATEGGATGGEVSGGEVSGGEVSGGAARGDGATSFGPRAGYGWPLPGTPTVTRRFDPPPQPWLPGHRGVDLAGHDGEPVLAAGPGVVVFAGSVAGTGVVSIDHPGGLRTTYQPLRATVHAGDRVRTGDRIGTLQSGHPGCPAEACLHWGLRRGVVYLDPLALLGLGQVRLLPLRPRTARGTGR
ncbi:MAG: M23 family metallopeptidase [Actinocatenispora sp.]